MSKVFDIGRWHRYEFDGYQIWSTSKNKETKLFLFGIIEYKDGGIANIFNTHIDGFNPILSEYFSNLNKAKIWMETHL